MAVYPFNNETLANDVSPYKGIGHAVGTTFSPGIHGEPGGSIEIQGTEDSYIELQKTGSLDTRKSITIVLYVYPLGSAGPIVNYKKDGHGVQLYESDRNGRGTLAARINRRNQNYKPEIRKVGILRSNEWHFVGVSYNWSTGVVKLWHDRQQVASKHIGRTEIATQFDVRVGARQIVNDFYFGGRVACLQFYSKALTQRQIVKAQIACKPCKLKQIFVKLFCYIRRSLIDRYDMRL